MLNPGLIALKKSTHFRFIDLAQIICKVPETVPDHLSSSEDEMATGYASEPGGGYQVSPHLYFFILSLHLISNVATCVFHPLSKTHNFLIRP